jgi:dipeptidyl-peptidase 4
MKRTIFAVVFFISLSAFLLNAQDKQLTINDAVVGQWTNLRPENMSNLQWRGDLEYFTFIKENKLIQQSTKSSREKTLLCLDGLNKILSKNKIDSIKRFPAVSWTDNNTFLFKHKKNRYFYNLKSKKISLGLCDIKNAKNLTASKARKYYAYTLENNLQITDVEGNISEVTKDENIGIVNGQTVHRSEFGIHNGIFWSPDGNFLAFYRKDETMVTDYPLVDITTRVAELKNTKYPMAGMTSEQVTVGIFNVKTKSTIFLKTGEPKEQYLTNISWSPDEKYIFVAVLNRGQNHMKYNKYDASTGNFVKTLFEEKHEKYVEPQHPAIYLKTEPENFIWQSRRDGFNHLYMYDTEGNLKKQLTNGEWAVTEIISFDKDEKNLFFMATKESPLERHLYKLEISSGKIVKLTNEKGTHRVKISKSGNYFVDNFSNTKTPNQYDIVSTNGKVIRNVLTAENPLSEFDMPEMEIFSIKAADENTDIYCRLIKPANFDESKKYPAVVYVYGGPHAQLITESWLGGARMWQYYMAQRGYVMLTVDSRGSAGRGLEFENVIFRNLGQAEMADQMKGIEYLKNLNFVDAERIGVHGWSYGGFMTTSLLTNFPETFKVGVAGGPVIDWKYYEVMYGERYMDTPEENPEGYEKANLVNQAENLKGKLLIIHGAIDPTVVIQNSMDFVQKCIDKNIPIDFFVYPKSEHNVRGYNRIHLMDKVSQYFDDYLK